MAACELSVLAIAVFLLLALNGSAWGFLEVISILLGLIIDMVNVCWLNWDIFQYECKPKIEVWVVCK